MLYPPNPSPPFRPPVHVIYCDRGDGRRLIVSWAATYAARHWLDEITAGCKIIRLARDTIALDDGDIEIRCDELQKIMDYRFTPEEREWTLPSPFVEGIARFCGVRRAKRLAQQVARAPRQVGEYVTISQLARELGITPREARARLRQAKVSKPQHGRWEWPAEEAKRIVKLIA